MDLSPAERGPNNLLCAIVGNTQICVLPTRTPLLPCRLCAVHRINRCSCPGASPAPSPIGLLLPTRRPMPAARHRPGVPVPCTRVRLYCKGGSTGEEVSQWGGAPSRIVGPTPMLRKPIGNRRHSPLGLHSQTRAGVCEEGQGRTPTLVAPNNARMDRLTVSGPLRAGVRGLG
jgi:hypothetical protein